MMKETQTCTETTLIEEIFQDFWQTKFFLFRIFKNADDSRFSSFCSENKSFFTIELNENTDFLNEFQVQLLTNIRAC